MSQLKTKTGTTIPSLKSSKSEQNAADLLFGKKNYLYLGAGVLLIFIGFALMAGGSMPSPDVWDESLIYSFRRITLAPIVILIGLFLSGMAIFAKK
jgi:sulfite exporter TauE/SafE